ncbi:MAG: PilZ domain-containing protein [Nitrospira sp.]|nr:PilZ domain-containing protein [Nitrospira sp.]
MSHFYTRRMYRRISAEYSGCYLTSYSVRPAVVRDISLNGFRVEGPPGLSCVTLVKIQLWLPNGEGIVDIDQAMVRWMTEREFGVQIVSISNEADLRLAHHVEQRLRQVALNVAC